MADNEGYNAKKSQVTDNSLIQFIQAPVEHDLKSVPGLGPVAIEKLKEAGIESTFHLIGQFLYFAGPAETVTDTCDEMWYFLQNVGISSYRSGIVKCLAEKCETLFPQIFMQPNDEDNDKDEEIEI